MSHQSFLDGRVTLWPGDSREVLRGFADASFDSVVTDPPYALVSIGKRFGAEGAAPAKAGASGAYARAASGFMGQQWDTGETAFDPGFWREVLRVLKPGGHVVAFGGTRSYHRLACAIEDAGFEIRDQLGWCYGSGFPKSHDVSKGIDKAAGLTREVIRERYTAKRIKPGATVVKEGAYGKQDISFTATDPAPASEASAQWQGWGTALKPAWEPIVLARKPMAGTVAANVLAHGTGALNIGGCRVGGVDASWTKTSPVGRPPKEPNVYAKDAFTAQWANNRGQTTGGDLGRWPANIVHDGSDEVVAAFPQSDSGSGSGSGSGGIWSESTGKPAGPTYGDGCGSAARFFYSAKADANDRIGSKHPTVKPVDLMQWLCRLVTPPGGTVLDPFAGSGSTGEAAWREGFKAVLIEREEAYQADIARRLEHCLAGPMTRKATIAASKADKPLGGLFGGEPGPRGGAGRPTAISPTRTTDPVGRVEVAP